MSILKTNTSLVCPRSDGSGLVIDLTVVHIAEDRIQEVAIVNQHRAPELLAVFNQAYLHIRENKNFLELESIEAHKVATKRKSVMLLDQIPDILEQKGLSNTKAHQEAVLALDPEYEKALEIAQHIDCVIALLETKMEAIVMAYNSVKKIIGQDGAMDTRNRPGCGIGKASTGMSDPTTSPSQHPKELGTRAQAIALTGAVRSSSNRYSESGENK